MCTMKSTNATNEFELTNLNVTNNICHYLQHLQHFNHIQYKENEGILCYTSKYDVICLFLMHLGN